MLANAAGMMAKYFETSFAMLKVVSGAAGHQELLSVLDYLQQLGRFESRSTRLPASFAACVPVFIATATSA